MNQKDAVFIWIPKTAGTSLRSIIRATALSSLRQVRYGFANQGTITFGHMDYAQLVKDGYVSESFDRSSFKFAFTRNPYDRVVSLYFYLIVKLEYKKVNSFLEFCRLLKKEGYPPIGLYNVQGLSQCNPQVRWIENTRLDYIGKVESLSEDTGEILTRLGLPQTSIPVRNATNHHHYTHYYCKESRQIIEELYKEDFKAFNYTYDD
jgi:hypothetical protein